MFSDIVENHNTNNLKAGTTKTRENTIKEDMKEGVRNIDSRRTRSLNR